MLDINKLRGAIYLKHRNAAEFAAEIGFTRQKITQILNGRQRPSIDDARVIADGLKLTDNEAVEIFLARESVNH